MIRQPSNLIEAFEHWRRRLDGELVEMHESDPMPGFYRMRKVKNGPLVPVAIFIEQDIDPETGELTDDERIACLVNGKRTDPESIWTYCAPITEEEYHYLRELHRWAKDHDPDHPAANPNRKIDLAELPPVF